MTPFHKLLPILRHSALACLCLALLGACAVSPETQARMDEYDRTIPSCASESDCSRKWETARAWAAENSDFGIRGESDTRIMATSNIVSTGGIGVVVNREAAASGYQLLVDVECFSAYGCPDVWELKVDFNRAVNATP